MILKSYKKLCNEDDYDLMYILIKESKSLKKIKITSHLGYVGMPNLRTPAAINFSIAVLTS